MKKAPLDWLFDWQPGSKAPLYQNILCRNAEGQMIVAQVNEYGFWFAAVGKKHYSAGDEPAQIVALLIGADSREG